MFQRQDQSLSSAKFVTYPAGATHKATLNLWATHVTSTGTTYV
jgi:hypothetical protein